MVDFDLLLGYTCENSNSDGVRSLTTCNISPIKFGAILCPLIALCLFKALLFLKLPQSDQIPRLPPPPTLPPALPPTLPPLPPTQQPPTLTTPPPP